MHPLAHLVLLLVTAAIVVATWVPLPRWAGAVAGATVVLPVLVAPLPFAGAISGHQGAIEAITEGLLAALLVRSVVERRLLIGLGAAVFLAEEVDYGQVFLHFATPEPVLRLGSRSDQLNFHNLAWLHPLWRLAPMIA